MRCDAVYSGRHLMPFGRTFYPCQSASQKWRQRVSPKRSPYICVMKSHSKRQVV